MANWPASAWQQRFHLMLKVSSGIVSDPRPIVITLALNSSVCGRCIALDLSRAGAIVWRIGLARPIASRRLRLKTGYGVAELFAKIETTSGIFVSKTVRLISVADGVSPFNSAFSEFNLPLYLFGSSLARFGASGPEVGLGADCANFIIYGLRECRWQIRWSDAGASDPSAQSSGESRSRPIRYES